MKKKTWLRFGDGGAVPLGVISIVSVVIATVERVTGGWDGLGFFGMLNVSFKVRNSSRVRREILSLPRFRVVRARACRRTNSRVSSVELVAKART